MNISVSNFMYALLLARSDIGIGNGPISLVSTDL